MRKKTADKGRQRVVRRGEAFVNRFKDMPISMIDEDEAHWQGKVATDEDIKKLIDKGSGLPRGSVGGDGRGEDIP